MLAKSIASLAVKRIVRKSVSVFIRRCLIMLLAVLGIKPYASLFGIFVIVDNNELFSTDCI